MPTMILVEDESFERASLKNCINWDMIGVRIIGEAENGSQGLAMVMNLHPDIVLTDVKMPVMNGIEMARQIRRLAPETKILFLSSYDDFEYAQQAIDLNISAYVTKPVNEIELLRLVKRTVDEITDKELEKKLLNKIKSDYAANLNLARQAFINRVLAGMPVNRENARNLDLEWLCESTGSYCILLSFYEKEKVQTVEENIDTLNRHCLQICGMVTNTCIHSGVLITIACFPEEAGEDVIKELKQALTHFFEKIGCSVTRIEAACNHGKNITLTELYEEILKKSTNTGAIFVPEMPAKKKSKQQIVEEIEKIIRTQYSSPLTIESIAKMLHFTPNYIGTVFKLVKKISINRYLTNVRIEKAEELLKDNKYTINDIAIMCGYNDISYFHTIFKKEKGITPSEYRRRYANG